MTVPWGGYYEAVKELLNSDEEINEKDPVFSHIINLEKTTTYEELENVLRNIPVQDQNKLNSPALDLLLKRNLFSNLPQKLLTFCHVCEENNIPLLEFLLRRMTPSPDEVKYGIRHAAYKGHFEPIKKICGYAPFDWLEARTAAIEGKNLELVKFLSSYDNSVSSRDFVKCSVSGTLDILKYLFSLNLGDRTYPYSQMAQNCIEYDNVDMLEYLYDNNKIFEPSICLNNAVILRKIQAVKMLIFKGIRINLTTIENIGNSLEIIKLLDENKMLNVNMERSLEIAVRAGSLDVVQFFLEKKEVKITDKAILLAASSGFSNILKLFLKNQKVSQEFLDKTLITAVQNGRTEICGILIENGADIHAEHEEPLLQAVKNSNYPLIKILVNKGADVNKMLRLDQP